MKTRFSRLISLLLLLCIIIGSLASCDLIGGIINPDQGQGDGDKNQHTHVDYLEQVKFDPDSTTAKLEVTVKMHIDGDTTHFNVPRTFDTNGYIKARYLAVNTPESTGKIEEWGKKASKFTQEKLATATSIYIESDNDRWNYDGNGRYLVWVWYQPEEGAEYRNLNIELLQEGLAVGSKTSETRYGDIAVAAINQAMIEKLYVFSDAKDPEFCYDGAVSVTLKELRLNAADYDSKAVSVEGVVVYNSNYTVYIEAYDPETDMNYGMQVFYGYDSNLHSVFAQGNKVRVVGKINNFHGTWQISDINYNPMKPKDPANTAKLSEGESLPFTEITAEKFYSNVTINVDDGQEKTYKFTQLAVSTSVSMKNLEVIDVYTTKNGDSAGAMTITCRVDGKEIDVRTEVLKDANGIIVTEQDFRGKTIDVKGLIEYFDLNDTGNGTYQIKVYSLDDITIH